MSNYIISNGELVNIDYIAHSGSVVRWAADVPSDMKTYVAECKKLGLPVATLTPDRIASLRYYKNAGYTPQDMLRLYNTFYTNPKAVPDGIRKLFNLSLISQKVNSKTGR